MRTLDDALRDCIALIFDLERKADTARTQGAVVTADAFGALAVKLRDIFSDVPEVDLDILRAHRQLIKHVNRATSGPPPQLDNFTLKQTRTVTLQAGTWTLSNGRQVVVPSGETLQIEVPIDEWYECAAAKRAE